MGYNALDNTLYAVVQYSPPEVIQIGARGEVVYTGLNLTPLGTDANGNTLVYNAGDVDEQGIFWVSNSGRAWAQIALNNRTIIASGTAVQIRNIIDWAYVPGGGNALYSVSFDQAGTGTTVLYRFDRALKTWTTVGTGYGTLAATTSGYGAVYASSDGFLYASDNNSGVIYRFSLDGRTVVRIATGPTSSSNDGAHCIYNGASS